MSTNYHILLIEDEPEKWFPVFDQFIKGTETILFRIGNVSSLENGREYIIKNHLFLDAVLIEYNFPNSTLEDVLDEIHWIKKNFPFLPVFNLCANPASENIEAISSFIRAGSLNYFNISNFKPDYLAAHLFAAHEVRKIQQRYEIVTSANDGKGLETPCFISDPANSLPVRGHFAYSLEAIKKPRSDHEEVELIEYSLQWHSEFFRMLSILLDEKVTLSVRYLSNAGNSVEGYGKVGIFWHFTIIADSPEELDKEYKKTLRDINLYFGTHSLVPGNPYIFMPVTGVDLLQQLISPQYPYQCQLNRKSVECRISMQQVGYRKQENPDRGVLFSVFKMPFDWISINTFCKILGQEENPAQLEISIHPYDLSVKEKEESVKWASGLPDNFPLSHVDTDFYKTFLEGLAHGSFKPFLIRFRFLGWEVHPSDAIKSALFNAFALEQIEASQISQQIPLFDSIYPDHSLSLFSRLPLPQKEGIPGVTTVPENMLFFPANINSEGVITGHKKRNGLWNDIRINYPDLAQHAYILGQTGTGKSTMLYTMVMDMLKSGKHVSLIDPHGDLYDKVVKNMPESCKANTVFFNP
ncbi:MAG: DUF87 domain-containing protein, partial [Bacteroidota bacterium]